MIFFDLAQFMLLFSLDRTERRRMEMVWSFDKAFQAYLEAQRANELVWILRLMLEAIDEDQPKKV